MTNDTCPLFLGIEIGGTKLQLGIGAGDGSEFETFEHHEVHPKSGAVGILEQIEKSATALLQKHDVSRIGIGFGGPVDSRAGVVVKSHQIAGWEKFPLVDWCKTTFQVPTRLGNDCDAATLAEAKFGAGQGSRSVFFVTVGTGVGGGFVVDGKLHGEGRPAVAEIGHLRPGLHEGRPESTVESIASGWGITAAARARISGDVSRSFESVQSTDRASLQLRMENAEQTGHEYIADLLQRCNHEPENLTAKMIAQAAAEGNQVAQEILQHACQALGWAIAQVITLLAPEVIAIGGGVSLMGEQLFFAPLRREVERYVFPPLANSYGIVPAKLGEMVVVHGALALAAEQ